MKYLLLSLLFCTQVFAGPVVIWGPGPSAKFLAPAAIPSGTVGAPGGAFAGDLTSGWYLVGAGDVALATGGILAMEAKKVGANVNFGYGTAASAATSNPLTVSSSLNGGQFFQYGNTSTGASSFSSFQVLDGTPDVTVSLNFENHAYQVSGYLAAATTVFAGPNVGPNMIISNNSSTGTVILSAGGTQSLTTERLKIDYLSHTNYHGTTTSMGACGTTPSVAGNDSAGLITVGTGGAATSCVLNFANTWTTIPHCFASDETQIVALQVVPTATTLTITATAAFTASSKLDYFCVNHY